MGKYDDIINLPHWNPAFHPRMAAIDRAGQFAPFSALTGYDEMVSETARLTESKDELDEEQCVTLDETLHTIIRKINDHPYVIISCFEKDSRKKGGSYVIKEGNVRDVDIPNRYIILKNGDKISIDDIRSISLV